MRPNDPILRRCRAALESLYGQRLKGVILYGSTARGEDTAESDVDLLVLLDGPVAVGTELRRICHALYPVQLEAARQFSVMPAEADEYRQGGCRLYRNVQREGLPV
ncbi:MAG: nucleotidyltransferase domain-containing protein [Planctomycetes bacterium]|nr:nucleotidyltransferase domain-containing protein [Planctomycetota bacterium]